jgi:hypothetical protein
MDYDLYVNADSTVLVRIWEDGRVEVSTRSDPGAIWGPPIQVIQERPR